MSAKPKAKEHKRVKWSTVKPKLISWLWKNWIPSGKLTILVGDTGLGKTSLALDIAARLTTGRPMPLCDNDLETKPLIGNVLYQSHEDEVDDTLLPRCISAGVDRDRIEHIETDNLNIDEDCELIEQNIIEMNARLVIWDPLQSFMGKNADICRITDIRRLLTNLGGIAARNDCAMIIISHQTKSSSANEIHRVFGSVDITATARSVLRVSRSDDDPDTRILSHIKSSVSRPSQPIAFRILDNAPILYLGDYETEFDTVEIAEDYSKRAKAAEIICAMLKDGPVEGTKIFAACKEAGIGTRTVEQIKKELNVRSGRDGNKRIWFLG